MNGTACLLEIVYYSFDNRFSVFESGISAGVTVYETKRTVDFGDKYGREIIFFAVAPCLPHSFQFGAVDIPVVRSEFMQIDDDPENEMDVQR